jgi:hypothetical protein
VETKIACAQPRARAAEDGRAPARAVCQVQVHEDRVPALVQCPLDCLGASETLAISYSVRTGGTLAILQAGLAVAVGVWPCNEGKRCKEGRVVRAWAAVTNMAVDVSEWVIGSQRNRDGGQEYIVYPGA